jgi:hypothetical protein
VADFVFRNEDMIFEVGAMAGIQLGRKMETKGRLIGWKL